MNTYEEATSTVVIIYTIISASIPYIKLLSISMILTMILDDQYITIKPLMELIAKGKNITIAEKERLDNDMECLADAFCIIDTKTQETIPFTHDQQLFVKYILLTYIRKKLPKLNEVLQVYNLSIDTIFVWKDFHGQRFYDFGF